MYYFQVGKDFLEINMFMDKVIGWVEKIEVVNLEDEIVVFKQGGVIYDVWCKLEG